MDCPAVFINMKWNEALKDDKFVLTKNFKIQNIADTLVYSL